MVRNTRAKIRRTEKNYGVDLSDEVFIPESIEDFQTRKEFNEWKQKQSSFTNRSNLNYQYVKNPYDVVATKAQINKIERDTRRAQNLAKKEIKKQLDKPVIRDGEQTGTVRDRTRYMSEPDVLGITVPKDFNFKTVRNPQRLRDIEKGMKNRSESEYYDERKERMRDNFIKMLEETYNSDSEELIKELEDFDPDNFYDLYVRFPDQFNFEIYYINEISDEIDDKHLNDINKMIGFVKDYKGGKMNTDLKGF